MGREKRIRQALSVTDYFFSLPPLRYFILAIVLLGIVFGILINVRQTQGLELVIKGTLDGLFILTLPALLSALSVKLMLLKMPFKRIAAATFAGELLYALTYLAAFALTSFTPEYVQPLLVFGVAWVFVLWYVLARLVFVLRYRSFLFAGIQLLFHSAFLISSRVLYFEEEFTGVLGKFYLAGLVLLGAVYVFFFIINAPMKRSFGIASTDALAQVVAQWLYQSKEIEKTFAKLGEKAKTLVGILAFRRRNDRILFVVPYVHFGPFGNLGGSEFSTRIPRALQQAYGARTFVFHGTVTHDMNPISSNELRPLLDACRRGLSNARFVAARCSLSAGRFKECKAELLCVNNVRFASFTRAPLVTEDINLGVGLSLMSELEKQGGMALAVDQHNCETGEVTTFEPGSEVAYRYLRATQHAMRQKASVQPLRLGTGEAVVPSRFIGPGGIKTAVFSTSPLYATIVIDCNGITPAFRGRLIQEVEALAPGQKLHAAIFTTDTHTVNAVRGVLNPLEYDAHILKAVVASVRAALDDMQPAQFYAAKTWFDTRVFGAKQSAEIVSTINSILAVAKIVAPLLFLGGAVAVLFLLSRLKP